MEDLLARHQKELRDLTSRITQKKKSATKKTRKGINSECEALERQLKARHEAEISELENPNGNPTPDEEPEPEHEPIKEPKTDDTSEPVLKPLLETPTPDSTSTAPTKKPNRRKAALARRAAALASAASEAEAEAKASPAPLLDLRSLEKSQMTAHLRTHSLKEVEIAPDGHCLYRAFADQVPAALDYRTARRRCAEFMGGHADDFAPFIEGNFGEHVQKVGETAEWGGEAEVLALARAFDVVVNVVQAQGRGVERMNDGATGGEVWLGYYRHSFGLGEHYNSLRKIEGAK